MGEKKSRRRRTRRGWLVEQVTTPSASSFGVDLKPPPLLKSEQNQVPSPIRATGDSEFALPPLHAGQVAAYPGRCSNIASRYFGAAGGSARLNLPRPGSSRGSCKGCECAWLAPQHLEVWSRKFIRDQGQRLTSPLGHEFEEDGRRDADARPGGRLDFLDPWKTQSPVAGVRYHRHWSLTRPLLQRMATTKRTVR